MNSHFFFQFDATLFGIVFVSLVVALTVGVSRASE